MAAWKCWKQTDGLVDEGRVRLLRLTTMAAKGERESPEVLENARCSMTNGG